MDIITETMLTEFCSEHELSHLKESEQFEHFCCFSTVKQHHGEAFDTDALVVGAGGDTGIDAITVLVNGNLVTDVDTFEDIAESASYLEVTFIFLQAERSASFETSKIGSTAFSIVDFLKNDPSLVRNEQVNAAAELRAAIYKRASKFKKGNPTCRVYYVTTGKWTDDPNLEGRRQAAITDLQNTGYFGGVEFIPVDAEKLQKLYRQTRNAISRDFLFEHKLLIPKLPGVTVAYMGYLPAKTYLDLIQDEHGELLGNLFYDNVRDWQGDNDVNIEIKDTLGSDARDRFVLMNNGITVIARELTLTGDTFHIEDYQIVNGCQTSHVIFNQQTILTDSVKVPLRLIATQDEKVTNAIIRATNRQTEVNEEQFIALTEFPKQLELYCQSFQDQSKRIYYERRSRQYDRLGIDKTRIIARQNMVRAYASVFLDEPHRTTRNYAGIRAKIGKEIFVKGHRFEPYYAAAFLLYRLESMFRKKQLEPKYKPGRFHILLAARMQANKAQPPKPGTHEMEKYCKVLTDILWDQQKAEELITKAAAVVKDAANDDFDRDVIRTEPFTHKVVNLAKETG